MQQVDHRRSKARDDFETFQVEAASAQKRSLQLENQRLQKVEAIAELEISVRLLEEGQRSILGINLDEQMSENDDINSRQFTSVAGTSENSPMSNAFNFRVRSPYMERSSNPNVERSRDWSPSSIRSGLVMSPGAGNYGVNQTKNNDTDYTYQSQE